MDENPLILYLETSGRYCSVALFKGGSPLASRNSEEPLSHNAVLAPYAKRIMNDLGLDPHELDAVAVSGGPGSYTGMRVGVSFAKAMCFALDIPLLPVNTLEALALGAMRELAADGLYIPNVDARRMEVYCAKFDNEGRRLSEDAPVVIEASTFDDELSNGRQVVFCGTGTSKCEEVLADTDVVLHPMDCRAEYLVGPALRSYGAREFVDIAAYEPHYIKPPNITTPARKTL